MARSPSTSLVRNVAITQSAYGRFFANTMPASTRTPSSSPGLSAASTPGGSARRSRLSFGFFNSADASGSSFSIACSSRTISSGVDTFSSPRRAAAVSIMWRRSFVAPRPSDCIRALMFCIPSRSMRTLVAVLSLTMTMSVA